MQFIETLNGFKELVQQGFQNSLESVNNDNYFSITQLKAYLLESNQNNISDLSSTPFHNWVALKDTRGWFTNLDSEYPNSFFIDASDQRIWKLYSLLDVKKSDIIVKEWITKTKALDYCWVIESTPSLERIVTKGRERCRMIC